MKIKTSELTGPALNWAVAKCEGDEDYLSVWKKTGARYWTPDTNWAQGGPIIEREKITLNHGTGIREGFRWIATWWADNSGMAKKPAQRWTHNRHASGPTRLIAAMRCYVASKLGDEVDVPDELVEV